MEENKVTVIIPIHEYNEELKKYVEVAIKSTNIQTGYTDKIDVIVVGNLETLTAVSKDIDYKSYENIKVNEVVNTGKLDFQDQVNLAVKNVTTKYFTVLEFDDELSNKYFKNVTHYISSFPNIDIFLPLIVEVDENNNINKYTNENIWSQGFVGDNGEVGYLNQTLLKEYTDFKLSGAVIKTSEYINIGGYKSNIKMTFGYELLLRALNNSCVVYTIPRILYKHLVNRNGSLFEIYKTKISLPERKFWFDVANKEYHYINDREIDLSGLNK